MSEDVAERLDRIEAKLTEMLEDRARFAGILDAISDAMTAMAEHVDALTEALMPEEDEGELTSLDGTVHGGDRDVREPLDVL